MSINLNQVSFKAKYSMYLGKKWSSREDFNQKMDFKIAKMNERREQTNQIYEYFASPEGKVALERIPEKDEIYIIPLEGEPIDGDVDIEDSNLELEYMEHYQEGDKAGNMKFDDRVVPDSDCYLSFNDENPFSIQKVKNWLNTIASYHKI